MCSIMKQNKKVDKITINYQSLVPNKFLCRTKKHLFFLFNTYTLKVGDK